MGKWVMVLSGIAGVGLIFLAFLAVGTRNEAAVVAKDAADKDVPNVVFIVVDTLRADRIDAVRDGLPVMPKLSALAREGRRFTMAISPSSHTRTAVASLITGQFVDAHGVYFGARRDNTGAMTADNVGEEWVTLAESLTGHARFGYVTNGNVQAGAGYAQGFDADAYVYRSEARAEQVTNDVLERLETIDPPFFLFTLYLDPHAPYYPPDKYREMFGTPEGLLDSDREILQESRQIPYLILHVQQMLGQHLADTMTPLSEAGREMLRRWYDGECRYIDDQVSRLIESIRAEHPNTLFVLTSDHGEEFWEHEGMGHGTTLYQEQVRVPLILIGPGVETGVIDTPVSTVGIYRSIGEYLGIHPEGGLQGEDLLGSTFAGVAYSRTRGATTDLEVNLDAVQQWTIKAICDGNSLYGYDLQADPGEHRLLDDSESQKVLVQLLETHHRANFATRTNIPAASGAALVPEQEEALRNLGYLGTDESTQSLKGIEPGGTRCWP